MKQKYQVGDIVEAGMIVRVFHPKMYLLDAARASDVSVEDKTKSFNKTWGEEWDIKPIYTIKVDTPTRQMSYEDWLFEIQNIHWYKPEFYKEIYESVIPLRQFLEVPEHLVVAQILEDGGFDKEKVEKINEQI